MGSCVFSSNCRLFSMKRDLRRIEPQVLAPQSPCTFVQILYKSCFETGKTTTCHEMQQVVVLRLKLVELAEISAKFSVELKTFAVISERRLAAIQWNTFAGERF